MRLKTRVALNKIFRNRTILLRNWMHLRKVNKARKKADHLRRKYLYLQAQYREVWGDEINKTGAGDVLKLQLDWCTAESVLAVLEERIKQTSIWYCPSLTAVQADRLYRERTIALVA